MNYPTIYNLNKLSQAIEKDPGLSLSMTAAAALVGTFPATITRARKKKILEEIKRPYASRPEVSAKSVLDYFEGINRMAKLVKATAGKKKKPPVKKSPVVAGKKSGGNLLTKVIASRKKK